MFRRHDLGLFGVSLVGRRHDLHLVFVEDINDVAVQFGVAFADHLCVAHINVQFV